MPQSVDLGNEVAPSECQARVELLDIAAKLEYGNRNLIRATEELHPHY